MRLRVTLIIAFTNLLIILFSIFAGIAFVSQNIAEAQEADMQIVADIADKNISNEIELLFLKATDIAKTIEAMSGDHAEALENVHNMHPEFIGAAIFDASQGRITYAGESPAPSDALETTHISSAFEGRRLLGSTYLVDGAPFTHPGENNENPEAGPGDIVFYLAVPMPSSHDEILAMTLPGMFFHEMLLEFEIWETGHVFMVDAYGSIVSNPRPHWVYQRANLFEFARVDPSFESLAVTVRLMAGGEKAIGYYTVYDIPRVCAYMPVSGSEDGWSLGAVAPLPESPFRNISAALLVVGIIGFLLGLTAAAVAAGFIKKPFEEIKALQEESELNSQYKTQFLANMSHEMRTPLTSIIGFTELTLRSSKLDDTAHKNLVKVYRAGETLLGLINDILDISKIEANKFELNHGEYDLPSVLNDTITQSLIYVGEKPVELILDIIPELPRSLYGDELRVKQILNNLLSNAFKYTKEGTVELYVRCEQDGENVWLTARVTDTGIGIKEEDFEKLFTLYANMDKGGKSGSVRRIEGTGLGLSICKKMSEMMDGTIDVQSEYGKGSVFTVRLRQERVGDKTIGGDVVESLKKFHYSIDKFKNDEKTRINLSYASVLIVDDNTANLDVAKGLMNLYGIDVHCVTSGLRAIELIEGKEPRFSAIFMDHMMPGMDGIEALHRIRAIGTRYSREIPIIALTANAVIGNEEMFLSKGFQAFMAKPIDMTELDNVLRKWVRDRDAEQTGQSMDADSAASPPAETKLGENIESAEAFQIQGVDSAELLSRYQNEQSICLTALRSFATNASALMDKLRGPNADTLGDYGIHIHGLKGISANICASDISSRAAELEKLAKAGDLDGVLEKNEALIADAQGLIDRIKQWLGEHDGKAGRETKKAPDPETLEQLRKCCENFDIEGADRVMEQLEGADYEQGAELVAWLREKLTDSKFKEIAAKLGKELQ